MDYDKWDYKQEGLTGAGAAIIVIIVTVLTYGAGTGAAAGAAGGGAAAGSGAAGAAAATTATTATTTAAAMQAAALNSLYSQAAIAVINNKGNVGKALKDLGRSDTVKQVLTAAATAGVLSELSGIATAAGNQASSATGYDWTGTFTTNLINTSSAAATYTAINGGSLSDSLEKSILAALVQTGHGAAASKIKGITAGDNVQFYQQVAHKVAHAVAGCAAAAANRGKCQDGAIGAAVGEIVAEVYGKPANATEEAKLLTLSKVAAASAATLAGGDANTAANIAETAVRNNYLLRKDWDDYDKKLNSCGTDKKCVDNAKKELVELSRKRNNELLNVCRADPDSNSCKTKLKDANLSTEITNQMIDKYKENKKFSGDLKNSSISIKDFYVPDATTLKYLDTAWKQVPIGQYVAINLNSPEILGLGYGSRAIVNTRTGEVFISVAGSSNFKNISDVSIKSFKSGGFNIVMGSILNTSDLEKINIDKTITAALQGTSNGGQICIYLICGGGAKTIGGDTVKYSAELGLGTPSISLGVEKVARIGQVEYQNGKWNWKWEK